MRAFHRGFGVVVFRRSGRTFVEGHHDVGPDASLDVHHFFGRKQMSRAVDVRLERHAFLLHLADARERKHLKPATVGQNGPVPAVELVQAACRLKDVQTWTKVEMIGIAKDNLRLHFVVYIANLAGLDRTQRPDRHENRRLNRAMASGEYTRPGVAFRVVADYVEIHRCNFAQK